VFLIILEMLSFARCKFREISREIILYLFVCIYIYQYIYQAYENLLKTIRFKETKHILDKIL